MGNKGNTRSIKRTLTDWLKILVLLLDEAIVLVLVILLLRFFEVRIPLPVAIVIGLLVGGLIFGIHMAVIPTFHQRPVTGSEAMIGAEGTVVEPLAPVGAIIVNGECWRAKSVVGDIAVEEDVEIVGRDGLTLRVKRKEEKLISPAGHS